MERLLAVAKDQLAASRKGDLDAVAAHERERHSLIESLTAEEMNALAAADTQALRETVAQILESERQIKACLQAGIEKRRGELAGLEKRQHAERAYRGMNKRSR